MVFSYNWLQSFLEKKLPQPKKLAEILTMHSFEVEEIKKINGDWILDIDILPNRMPDCASHIGVTREIAALLDLKPRIPGYRLKEDKKRKINDILKVEVKDKNLSPRYCVRILTDIKVTPSPKWVQERLIACGLEPINNIVDATNYIMLETGQPLHAFDLNKISGEKSKASIVVRRAKKGENINILDGKTYKLDKDILVIANRKEPIAIAGIKGGEKAKVDKNTKAIVLEAANFDRLSIYRASKKLNLNTDASLRFSSGLDPNLVSGAIDRVASFIQNIARGKIVKGIIDIYSKKILSKKIKLNLDYVESLLGREISEKEIVKIFKALEFKVIKYPKGNYLIVEIPTFRKDISCREDLIEEIGRIYGYEKIKGTLPILPITVPEKNEELLWERKIKNLLKGLGFIEVYTYSFISEKDRELFLGNKNSKLIEIENPVSSNTKYLRPSLLPNFLKVIKDNQKRFSIINIFEVGKVYQKSSNKKQYISEKRMFGGAILGKNEFFELKGKIEALFENLGISNIYFDSYQPIPEDIERNFWQKKKIAEMRINNDKIGFLGKISDKVGNFYQLEKPLFAFEIDFEKLLKFVSEEHEYEAPSPYPEMIRDLAILVPIETLAGEIIQKIHLAEKDLIRDIEIFDIFEGPPLPKGKKNLAFHIIYQAKDRTLISKEVDKIQKKIIKILEENPDWEVRR